MCVSRSARDRARACVVVVVSARERERLWSQGYVNPSLRFLFYLNRISDFFNAEYKPQVILAIFNFLFSQSRQNVAGRSVCINDNDNLFFQLPDRQKRFAIVTLPIVICLQLSTIHTILFVYVTMLRHFVARKSSNSLIERIDYACY